MALYDYIRVQWSDGCDIDNIYYKGGFQNEMFFVEDLSTPQYEIEDEVKKQDGVSNPERQIWYKKFTLEVKCVEAVADILTSIPLHETVTVSDKNGNAFTCGGADVEIDVTPAEVPELIEGTYYPVAFVKFTFTADHIVKACCPADQLVECTDTDAPVIATITEPVAGSVKITGTADETTLIRMRYREFLEGIKVGNGLKVNDVCFVSATIAYCCSNLGGVYKTTDGGNTWTIIGSTGGVQLNGIAFDGTDKVYAIGDVTGGQAACVVLTVGVDTLANVNTGLNENLKAVSFGTADGGYAVGAAGSVLYFDGAAWNNVTPGTVTILRDVATVPGNNAVAFVVGLDYVAHTSNNGAAWTLTNYAGENFIACANPDNDVNHWYFGNANGDIRYTANAGVVSVIEKAGTGVSISGITATTVNLQIVIYALYKDGYIITDDFHDTTWTNKWKLNGAPVCNRIRAYVGTNHELLVARNDEYCATTETPINDGNYSTAIAFNVDGLTQVLVNNVTYEVDLETYLLNSDPCKDCDNQLFTT